MRSAKELLLFLSRAFDIWGSALRVLGHTGLLSLGCGLRGLKSVGWDVAHLAIGSSSPFYRVPPLPVDIGFMV